MHYHLEVIMPKTNDIGKALAEIMEPFNENNSDTKHGYGFWDWYVTVGRYASPVEDIPENLECERVIIAKPKFNCGAYDFKHGMKAGFMIVRNAWNGVCWMPIHWDGLVKTAIGMYDEKLQHSRQEYKDIATPNGGWICVTVNYHS